MKALDLALTVESNLNDEGVGYHTPKAYLYAINTFGEWEKANEQEDVYDLLAHPLSTVTAGTSDFIGVLTCGWASPVGDDDEYAGLPPSQHPKRRRVRLFVLASKNSVASVLRFSDEPDEVVTDEGDAYGSLADAVHNLFARAKQETN